MELIENNNSIVMPVLVLRGLTIFPGVLLSFDVGREKSVKALEYAIKQDQTIFVVPQKDALNPDPTKDDLSSIGVVSKIKSLFDQSNNVIKVTVEGCYRAEIEKIVKEKPFFSAVVKPIEQEDDNSLDVSASVDMLRDIFRQGINSISTIPTDLIVKIENETEPNKLVDMVSYYFINDNQNKMDLLSERSVEKRLEKLIRLLLKEIDISYLKMELLERVKDSFDEESRKYYLRKQLKLITEELGEELDSKTDADEIKRKILELRLDKSAEEKLLKECNKLSRMPYDFQEANVIKSYLDICIALPWNKSTKDHIDLARAQKILDKDHYGLKKVKERIIEILAVRKLSGNSLGQIICLVGPPGVGKTSIAKSIAKALGRKYARVSLGGVRDEADIRGHRKTYIGAMPGRIISAINTAGSNNPLILLDEIDKLGRDALGDPTSAMLEVLDPEQNSTFFDHYLDINFDLSKVLFITTANDYDSIPAPLLDRMDIVKIEGYTREEKFNIARQHLIPKNLKKSGLTLRNSKITDEALKLLIDGYTREAGVRDLERKILSIFRKTAKELISSDKTKVLVDEKVLETMLGPRKFRHDKMNETDEVGVAKGLAWTAMGGETMPIEVAVLKGNGKIHLTGSLGDVMKESADIAISCVRSMAEDLGIKQNFYKKNDIHIHVPEGAVPKDGPSAGVTLATSVISALTGIPVKRNVAMTGEITLRGKVLPIGGLKEKSMAAYITGIHDVIIPRENEPDLSEIDEAVKSKINFILADDINTVISNALVDFKDKGELNVEENSI